KHNKSAVAPNWHSLRRIRLFITFLGCEGGAEGVILLALTYQGQAQRVWRYWLQSPMRPSGSCLLRPLSCYQAVGGLRLAGPALSFAKPPSDKDQDKQNASRLRADLAQLISRVLSTADAAHVS